MCRGWESLRGEFADGLKHGRGTLTLPSGDSITGNGTRATFLEGWVYACARLGGGILSWSLVFFFLPSRDDGVGGSQYDRAAASAGRRDARRRVGPPSRDHG